VNGEVGVKASVYSGPGYALVNQAGRADTTVTLRALVPTTPPALGSSLNASQVPEQLQEQEVARTQAAASSQPTTAPAALAPDDVVAITNRDTNEVTVQRVSPQGDINLAEAGKVKALGRTTDELAKDISSAYGQADEKIGERRVSVRRMAPSTQVVQQKI